MATRKGKTGTARGLSPGHSRERSTRIDFSERPFHLQLTEVLQALAHPTSRHFIELLAVEPQDLKELMDHFDLELPEMRHAARMLSDIGLLRLERDLDRIYFEGRALELVRAWLDRIADIRAKGV